MRCFNEFKNDRICDLCKVTNNKMFLECKHIYDKKIEGEFKLGDIVLVNNSIKGEIAIIDNITRAYVTLYYIRISNNGDDGIYATPNYMKLIQRRV